MVFPTKKIWSKVYLHAQQFFKPLAIHGGFVLDGVGVVSAVIIGARLGGLIVSISAGGASVLSVGSLNDQDSKSMEGAVGRATGAESVGE